MSHPTFPHNLDLAEYARLDYAEFTDYECAVATFRLWYVLYRDAQQELEHECNAETMLARVKAADADAGNVTVDGPTVTVYVRDGQGELTAAYRELVDCHETINNQSHLDHAAYQSRLEAAADANAKYHLDTAREIVEGGQAAFEADAWCQLAGGEWADLGDDDEARIGELAWRMSYQAIDEG